MKRVLTLKALLALAVLVILSTEAILRWGVGLGNPPLVKLNADTEYELIGPAEYSRWGNRISINAQGLRAPAFEHERAAHERRLLLIGDSVIYGGHFIDQSQTIANHLTEYLSKQAGLSECQVLVLPIATSSWGPVNQAGYLKRSGTFEAQSAGIVVSAHDLYDTPQAGSEILPYRTNAPFSAVSDAVEAVVERLVRRAPPAPKVSIENRAAQTLAALDQMAAQLRFAGIGPVLFFHPTVSERNGVSGDEARAFESWANRNGVRFVDMGASEISADKYRDEIHPNAQGTIALANIIARTLGQDLESCSGNASEP